MIVRRQQSNRPLRRFFERKRIQVGSTLLGLAVVSGGMLLSQAAVMLPLVPFFEAQAAAGLSFSEFEGEFARILFSPMRMLYLRFVAAFFVALGAFVVALRVTHSRVQHALGLGLVCLAVITVPSAVFGNMEIGGMTRPLWTLVLEYVQVLPAAYAGGWLGSKFRPRETGQPAP